MIDKAITALCAAMSGGARTQALYLVIFTAIPHPPTRLVLRESSNQVVSGNLFMDTAPGIP